MFSFVLAGNDGGCEVHQGQHCQEVEAGDPAPPLSPGEASLECWVSSGLLSARETSSSLRLTKMMSTSGTEELELEHLSCQERLGKLICLRGDC